MSGSYKVDVEFLRSIVAPLRQSVEVARVVQSRSGQLATGMGHCGSGQLQAAAGELLDRWGYGMGLIADDGDRVASGLDRAAGAYAHTERSVAQAATDVASTLPDSGQGER